MIHQRPNMDEVVQRFEVIRKGLSNWKLRSKRDNNSTYNPYNPLDETDMVYLETRSSYTHSYPLTRSLLAVSPS
jgi:hypothetical protein